MPFRACTVTFRDHDGVQQKAHVDAETAFEAAALAMKFWSTRHFVKGPNRRATLTVEVERPARLLIEVKVSALLDWLYVKPARTPQTAARIQRLRGLLADDRY